MSETERPLVAQRPMVFQGEMRDFGIAKTIRRSVVLLSRLQAGEPIEPEVVRRILSDLRAVADDLEGR